MEKIKQREMVQAKRDKLQGASDEDDENYDDDDVVESIDSYVNSRSTQKLASQSSTPEAKKPYKYGWFDIFLLFCLLFGIALIFYQNLWSGRFCRKRLYQKVKSGKERPGLISRFLISIMTFLNIRDPATDEDEDDEESYKDDNPIIKEEFDFMGESVEMPRVRKRHED